MTAAIRDARGSTAVVALGANLGDRGATLEAAVRALTGLPLTDEVRVSPVLETVAVTLEGEDAEAPRYLNAVALVTTRLAPSVLLQKLQEIEADHGRVRRERWGDRTLDLDIVSFGGVVSRTAELTLPHPRAAEREFVLRPWLDADPDAELPGVGRVDSLLERRKGGDR